MNGRRSGRLDFKQNGDSCLDHSDRPNEKENALNKIGFIGAGQMAKSLAVGIARSEGKNVRFIISDPNEAACVSFEEIVGSISDVSRGRDNQTVASDCDVVFLAMKPQFIHEAIEGVPFGKNNPLIVSIVAGVDIFQLERLTGTERLIRVMPNTPCLIGQGVCAVAAREGLCQEDVGLIKGFLKSIGKVVEVDERMMDSVTGLSGSGPAYVFSFLESLIDGAVLVGMPRETARQLAIQTVRGATAMLEQTGEHPAVLRDRVTSPGGTTIAGMKALEEAGFRDAVMSAVQAATERAGELGR